MVDKKLATATVTPPAARPEPCKSCGATVFALRQFCTIENGKAKIFGLEAQCVQCGLKRIGQLER